MGCPCCRKGCLLLLRISESTLSGYLNSMMGLWFQCKIESCLIILKVWTIGTGKFPLLESLLGWMNVYISLILLFKMFIIIFLPLYSYKNPFLVDQLSSERFREICSPCIGVDTSLEWRWSSALPRNPNRQWWQCNNLFEVLFD